MHLSIFFLRICDFIFFIMEHVYSQMLSCTGLNKEMLSRSLEVFVFSLEVLHVLDHHVDSTVLSQLLQHTQIDWMIIIL